MKPLKPASSQWGNRQVKTTEQLKEDSWIQNITLELSDSENIYQAMFLLELCGQWFVTEAKEIV